MSNLIIVESPTKARTLSRFLGSGYDVEATMGHLKDLPKSKLGVDVEHNFKPDFVELEKNKDSITKLKKDAKRASIIYLATDPDREGEAIAKHVEEILTGSKPKISESKLKRIVFHEITKSAVEEAVENPRKIDKNLVNAQTARRVLDRLVGYKLSPLLWKKVRRGLSAGRVQSVAVRLIVEREREIEKFKPDEYWEIFVEVEKVEKVGEAGKEKFVVNLIKINGKKAEIHDGKKASEVVDDLEKAGYKVLDVVKREVKKNPYPPFTTSTMTQSAARLFSWSAKKTMAVAQRLYEEGLITYHRTDSTNLAAQAITSVRKYIQETYGDAYLPEKPKFYKTSAKVAQEAHEAIRPTKVKIVDIKGHLKSKKFVGEAERLYKLIWKRFVACQMNPSIYDETRIDVEAKPKSKSQNQITYLLRTTGQIMKFDGWRKVIPPSKKDDVQILPELVKDEELDLVKVNSEQKFTQPPPRYNEASLIKTLEKLGIGRPSTYAPIISTIRRRQYVEKEEGRFIPTEIGIAVNHFLVKNFPDVFDYSFTAEMEDDLDQIARGEEKWTKTIESFWNPLGKKLGKVEKSAKRVKIEAEKLGKKCPKCKKGELVVRIGRFGKFVSCSRFPDCDYKERYLEKVGMKCPECKKGDVIVKTTRKGRKFFGCTRYPDCKWASWTNPKKKKKEQTSTS